MTDLVSPEDIERIVGIQRHPTRHYARAVSAEQVVYILHSKACVESESDLRDCFFSLALDKGIEEHEWSELEDRPVHVTVSGGGHLVPVRLRLRGGDDRA